MASNKRRCWSCGRQGSLCYDAWGRTRDWQTWALKAIGVVVPFSDLSGMQPRFDRGYTGHEMLCGFGLINMNGRLYDPYLQRFLSPDNVVQSPTNPQSYNRYSYCINNPLRYTDPSGYTWWSHFTGWVGENWKPIAAVAAATVLCVASGGFGAALIGAGVFGSGNLAVQAMSGNIHNFGDAFRAFGTGAVAGYCLGAGIGAGLQVPILSAIIKGAAVLDAAATSWSFVKGLDQGLLTNDWSGLANAGKIFLGNFALNSRLSAGDAIWEGISRFSWEGIQQTVGYSMNQVYNCYNKTNVSYFDGATLVNSCNDPFPTEIWGLTMGNFIMGQNLKASITDKTFMHEYGHTLQSQAWGLAYSFAVAIPSGWNYGFGGGSVTALMSHGTKIERHQLEWYEREGSSYAADYFKRYYNINWDEDANPTQGF